MFLGEESKEKRFNPETDRPILEFDYSAIFLHNSLHTFQLAQF